MTNLSPAQMQVVMHGLEKETPTAMPQVLPTWPFDMPDWALDAYHMYLEGKSARYANLPILHLKTTQDAWPCWDGLWEEISPGCYLAQTEDGRAQCHYHNGKVSQCEDGSFETTKQEGYGGRTFTIKMKDGRTLHLRGPWHGCPPKGWQEVIVHDMKYPRPYSTVKGEPNWFHTQGTFGFLISNDLFLRLVARFLPHLRVSKVKRYGYESLVLHHNGQPPKGFK